MSRRAGRVRVAALRAAARRRRAPPPRPRRAPDAAAAREAPGRRRPAPPCGGRGCAVVSRRAAEKTRRACRPPPRWLKCAIAGVTWASAKAFHREHAAALQRGGSPSTADGAMDGAGHGGGVGRVLRRHADLSCGSVEATAHRAVLLKCAKASARGRCPVSATGKKKPGHGL